MATRAPGRRATKGRRFVLAVALGLCTLVGCLVASLVVGTSAVSLHDAMGVIVASLSGGYADPSVASVVLRVRLPRALAGALCGCALATSGLLLQAALDNDLAAPSVMGVNSGAGLSVLVAALMLPGSAALRQTMAFAGALVASALVYLVSLHAGTSRTTLVLAGVAISSLMSAGVDAIITVFPDTVVDRSAFALGGFEGVTLSSCARVAPVIVAVLVLALALGRGIDLFALGDETAHGLGLNVRAYRLAAVTCSAVLAASAVSVCGLLGFVGLIVPNAVRMVSHALGTRRQIVLSCVWGAAFIVLCDLVARVAFFPYELPAGLVLSCLGAPFFIALLMRRRGVHRHHVSHAVWGR